MDNYREFDYIELGATLYTPATNENILQIASKNKFPHITSVVFCLEDSIADDEVEFALLNLQNFLDEYQQTNIKVFIRPRDIDIFQRVLLLHNIEKIDGFAFAKFGTSNMKQYFKLLSTQKTKFHIMPIIESTDMFHIDRLVQIRDFLLLETYHHIVTIRLGGEDMLKHLWLKKDCQSSIHTYHIAKMVFANVLGVFKPAGFNVTAPVYNCIENYDILEAEIKEDLKQGFFGKTIIHPDQGYIANVLYKVTQDELQDARIIFENINKGVFKSHDKMYEPKTHYVWANIILKRARIFGVFG